MKKSIFLFFAAILCAMTMNAKTVEKPRIYYDNSNTSYSSVAFVVGHNTYSRCYKLTNISNTNLWYRYLSGTGNDKWTDATQIAVFGVDWDSSEGSAISNRRKYTGDKYTNTLTLSSDLSSGKVYLVTASGNKSTTSIALKSGGYADLNYTQTVQQQLTTDGTTYNASTEAIATVKVAAYKLNDYNTTASNNGIIASGNSSATCSAARTATVTYTVSGVNSAYTFVGWYDGDTQKSTSSTYTYEATGAKTITARFAVATEEEHEVTITYVCGSNTVSAATSAYVGVETEKTFTAPTVTGYKFTNWTVGDGMTLIAGTTANDEKITVVTKSASSNYTLVANYEEVMETVYFINTGKWSDVYLHLWNGNATGTEWPGTQLTATGEKIGDYDVYSYTAKQGDHTNLLFHKKDDDNKKTGDLTWTAGKYYIHGYNGTTGWKTKEEAEKLLVVIPDYYITGTKELVGGEGWQANEKKMTYDNSSKTWSYKFNALSTGVSYALKVTDGAWGTGHSNWGFDAVKNPAAGVVDDGGNVGFKLATAGDVTVTFDGANITISTTGTFYVPKTYQYYIVGEMNGWSPNEDYGLSDDDTDGIYERELTWAAGTYIFKINIGKWDKQWGWTNVTGEYKEVQNANDDNKIKVVLDAEKTFTVKLDPTNDKISFADLTRPGRYLTGNDAVFGYTDGNWTPNTIQMTWDEANGIYTYTTPTLNANQNYIFRVTNGTWDGKWGYDKLNPAPENVLSFGDDKNICFMLASAGTITVTLDGDKLGLTTSSSFAAPVYTLVGDAAITGVHWNVNSAENQMVQDATDKNKFTLVKTVTAVAGEYEYKAIRNHSYEWEVAGDKVKIEKDGTGEITYTLDIATPKLTAKVSDWEEEAVAQVVVLDGIGEQKTFVEAGDKKSTSVNVVLEANQVYDFSVIVNSVYMNNNGSMWRENCTNWTFEHGANRAHIITDLAGTYTFTWTYEGNKLSVKYPEGTNVPAPVFLKGTMNSWNDYSTRLIPSADGETASVTITLAKGSYEFGIILGDKYLSNTGTMDSNNSTGWTFEKLTDTNAKIQASLTGEYTFTWTYGDSKQLIVTYPTLPEMQSGKFSTGKYEYAEFAPGNLQYYTGDKSWRFAQNQYDYVGEANINVGDPNYKGWIDMFGWSTDDENNNYGVNPNNVNDLYDGTFQDWGTKMGEGWSTLSADQWKYLLNTRPKAQDLKQIAKVDDVVGIMLFPDNWNKAQEVQAVEDDYFKVKIYNYTIPQWADLEAAGAIFLPAAGRRTGGYGNMINKDQVEETDPANLNGGHYKHQDNTNIYCYYWTSTINESTKDVSFLHNIQALGGDKYTIGTGAVWGEKGRYGQSVRLAKVTSTLIEIGDGDNSTVITDNAGKKVNVQVNRTFKADNGYYTICLPFDLDAEKIGKALQISSVTENVAEQGMNVVFTEVTNLVAGQPYLVLPSENLTNPIFENVTIVNTTGETTATVTGAGINITFTGIINGVGEQTDGSTEYYVGDKGWLYKEKVDKLGLRAFFTITDAAGQEVKNIRARVVTREDAATGFENITNGENTTIKLIENGQLIIIRNGEKFNAQGQKL